MCDAAQAIRNWVCSSSGVGLGNRRLFECDNGLSAFAQQHLGSRIGIAERYQQRRYPQRR
ncbi:hypothetical protein HLY00_591 [Mycolicibacterium hippocampi]|uniref:Uncharacterized protein n=1 Tax=Mycolicibacterium hippocampi TaxID=659824 RepID=A0A850PMS4_9MYCO|nr:hypothetical protein [Mycolicibacterium hippocampi]